VSCVGALGKDPIEIKAGVKPAKKAALAICPFPNMGESMKKSFVLLLAILICSTFLTSCKNEPGQSVKELQKQVQIEKRKTEAAQLEAAKSNRLMFIGITMAVALIALFAGVAIGSKARKDARAHGRIQRGENDEQQSI
jgi:hypothetical protein